MEIRVLGPVEALVDGQPLRFGRRQQRLVFGILAVQSNEVISADRLIDLIWGDRPPAHARAVLQTRISEVRTALHASSDDPKVRLLTTPDGYMLQAPPECVDASRFRSMLAQCRVADCDETARALLRTSLNLWHGPVLGGAVAAQELVALCYELESARLTAHEELFDIELRVGNHFQVVDEVVGLSAAHPTRERLFVLMMLALQRAGRGAEALQAYERWRRWLSEELGTDPGGPVKAMHIAILHGDAIERGEGGADHSVVSEPGFRVTVPRTLPADIADFTGREQEADLLRSVLAREVPGVVAVSGRGGVGKTALCVHVAHSLREQYVDGQLYVSLRGAGDDDPPSPGEVLARFLRFLGVDGSGLPSSLDERVELYRDLLSNRRVLIVLDNAATVEQVLPLIPGGSACGVLINSRARFGSAVGAHTLDLGVFTSQEAIGLLSRIAGPSRVSNSAAADLALLCGHLPLALRIAGAKLVAKPHWQVQTLVNLLREEHDRLDQFATGHLDVRASIALSYAGLNADAQRLLRLIGDIDLPDVTVWVCAALLDTTEADAQELLEQLFDAQLVDAGEQSVAGSQRYRLHGLVRLFAKEKAEQTEPGALEAARDRAYSAWLFVAQTAYEAVRGGAFQNDQSTTPRRPVSRHEIDTVIADPMRWFETEWPSIVAMVRRSGLDGRSAQCRELVCATSQLFEMRRYFDEWSDIIEIATAATRKAGDIRGLALMHYRMSGASVGRARHVQAIEYAEESNVLFEQIGDLHGQAMAITMAAAATRFQGKFDLAGERYQRALAMIRQTSDGIGHAFVLRGIGQMHMQRGEFAAAEAKFGEALDIYEANASPLGKAQVLFWRGMLRLDQARYQEAKEGFETALATCRVIGDRPGEAHCLRGLGLYYQRQGDRDMARTILLEALRLVVQPRPSLVETVVRRSLAELQ